MAKSSMHGEALACAVSVERAEKVAGMLQEVFHPWETTLEMLQMAELGQMSIPIDLVTDAKAMWDSLVATREPVPSDEGSLLWLVWIRERPACRAARDTFWVCTQDTLSDGLTKEMDPEPTLAVMRTGLFRTRYACLSWRRGLLDTHKGLPAPKSQRTAESQHFEVLLSKGNALFEELYSKICYGE